jgi:ABC-2 type transport system ATP-binding protein
LSVEHPTTTLEELFLSIVRDSEARPGRRVVGTADSGQPSTPGVGSAGGEASTN